MAVKKSRKKIIILIVVILVLLVGGAATYALVTGYFTPKDTDTDTTTKTGVYETFKRTSVKVDDLVSSGEEQSIKEANQIIEAEVVAADASGDDAYIVDAKLAKASFLINTGKAQEALDSILLPLDEKYGNNDTYKYHIYGQISWAYAELNNPAKADEYYNDIPAQGWD